MTRQNTHLRRVHRVQGTTNNRDVIGVLGCGHGVRREWRYRSFRIEPYADDFPVHMPSIPGSQRGPEVDQRTLEYKTLAAVQRREIDRRAVTSELKRGSLRMA